MNIQKYTQTLSTIDLHRTAVLAALWAFIEITLGTWLHAARVPFRGLILSVAAAGLLVFAKNIIRYRGSLIILGVITATVKSTLTGVFILNPIIAIMMESVCAECLFLIAKPNALSSILGGMVVLFYTFFHSVVAQVFFFGFEILDLYVSIIGKFIHLSIEKSTYALLIILGYMILHLIFGAFAGWFGYSVASKTIIQLKLRNESI